MEFGGFLVIQLNSGKNILTLKKIIGQINFFFTQFD